MDDVYTARRVYTAVLSFLVQISTTNKHLPKFLTILRGKEFILQETEPETIAC